VSENGHGSEVVEWGRLWEIVIIAFEGTINKSHASVDGSSTTWCRPSLGGNA
jgi:hypothetical protein